MPSIDFQTPNLLFCSYCTCSFSLALKSLEDIAPDYPFAEQFLGAFIAAGMAAENPVPISFVEQALAPMVETGKALDMIGHIFTALRQQLKVNLVGFP